MQTCEFTPEELDVLRDVVRHTLSEINMEVVRTDSRDFRTLLKHRREVLEKAMAKLDTAPVGA